MKTDVLTRLGAAIKRGRPTTDEAESPENQPEQTIESDIDTPIATAKDDADILETIQDLDLSGYAEKEEFLLDLAAVMARAHNTDDDLVDADYVAAQLSRWRATMTGRVVLPITLSVEEAKEHRKLADSNYGGSLSVTVPVSEKLIHDLDSQMEHVEQIQEVGFDAE